MTKKYKPLYTYIKGRVNPEHYTRIIPNKKKLEENKRRKIKV